MMARPKVEAYKHGQILIDGKSYEHDVVISGDRIQLSLESYKPKKRLGRKYIARLLEHLPEVLIIGLGSGAKLGLSSKAIALLEEKQVEWHALPTKEACKTYNRVDDGRHVVAMFHLGT
jgi:hypothetical protein